MSAGKPRFGSEFPPPMGIAGEIPRPSPSSPGAAFLALVERALAQHVSEASTGAILRACAAAIGLKREQLEPRHLPAILSHVHSSFTFLGVPPERRDRCLDQLRSMNLAERPRAREDEMITIAVEEEQDIVRARLACKAICQRLGFSEIGITKLMTAVSELSRNIHKYAGRGVIHISRINAEKTCVQIIASDRGPGIPDIDKVLSPSYRSKSGMGQGLRGTRALMDYFDIYSRPGEGTVVTVRKALS